MLRSLCLPGWHSSANNAKRHFWRRHLTDVHCSLRNSKGRRSKQHKCTQRLSGRASLLANLRMVQKNSLHSLTVPLSYRHLHNVFVVRKAQCWTWCVNYCWVNFIWIRIIPNFVYSITNTYYLQHLAVDETPIDVISVPTSPVYDKQQQKCALWSDFFASQNKLHKESWKWIYTMGSLYIALKSKRRALFSYSTRLSHWRTYKMMRRQEGTLTESEMKSLRTDVFTHQTCGDLSWANGAHAFLKYGSTQ